MRRLLVILLLSGLTLPAVALAGPRAADDGTLAIRRASGETFGSPVIDLRLDGAVVGHVNSGRLVVLASSKGPDPVVVGAERQYDRDDGATVYAGKDIGFKAIGGLYRLRVTGIGIDLNAVGQGKVALQGVTGKYSLNGGDWVPLPLLATTLSIGS